MKNVKYISIGILFLVLSIAVVVVLSRFVY